MSSIEDRKSKMRSGKIFIVICIILIIIGVFFSGYNFDKNWINGILFFVLSMSFLALMNSSKHYIETGIKLEDAVDTEEFEIYNKMNPIEKIRRNIIGILYVVFIIISISIALSSIFFN